MKIALVVLFIVCCASQYQGDVYQGQVSDPGLLDASQLKGNLVRPHEWLSAADGCCSTSNCAPSQPPCGCCNSFPCNYQQQPCTPQSTRILIPAKVQHSLVPQFVWAEKQAPNCVCGSPGCNPSFCQKPTVEAVDRNADCCSQQPCGQRRVCPQEGKWEADSKDCHCKNHVLSGHMNHKDCPCAEVVEALEGNCCRQDCQDGQVRCKGRKYKKYPGMTLVMDKEPATA